MTDRKYFSGRQDPQEAFLKQLERLFSLDLKAVVLREKDLGPEEYLKLAEKVKAIAGEESRCRLILHQFPEAAEKLGIDAVHLPLKMLRELREKPVRFREVIDREEIYDYVLRYVGADGEKPE